MIIILKHTIYNNIYLLYPVYTQKNRPLYFVYEWRLKKIYISTHRRIRYNIVNGKWYVHVLEKNLQVFERRPSICARRELPIIIIYGDQLNILIIIIMRYISNTHIMIYYIRVVYIYCTFWYYKFCFV